MHLLLQLIFLLGVVLANDGTSTPSEFLLTEVYLPQSPDAGNFVTNCKKQQRTAQVEFYVWKIEGIEYRRMTLSDEDMACFSKGAVMISATSVADCAKKAAGEGFNSFYVDAQNQCFGSNQIAENDGASCSAADVVVYSSSVAVSNVTRPDPTLESFDVADVELDSFTVQFTPMCEGFEYKLFVNDVDLGIIESPKTVTSLEVPEIQTSNIALEVRLEAQVQANEAPYSESVTIMTPSRTCELGNSSYKFGDSFACYQCTPDGFIPDNSSSLMTDAEQLERDTCCTQAAEGYCLVAECAPENVTQCEAEARCRARGFSLASRYVYENRRIIYDAKFYLDELFFFHVALVRGDDGVWRWLDDMSELGEAAWEYEPEETDNCAKLLVGEGIFVLPEKCSDRSEKCALCYGPNTTLSQCNVGKK